MGFLHWLILIPYYFFGALAALAVLILLCRLLRLTVSIATLVGTAIGLAVAGTAIPLACGWVDRDGLTGGPLLALAALSLVVAGVDAAVAKLLPLRLDAELRDL